VLSDGTSTVEMNLVGWVSSTRIRASRKKSMHVAIQELGLESIDVVHVGAGTYPLSNKIRALAVSRLTTDLIQGRRAGRQ
jgi:hypothetical protein